MSLAGAASNIGEIHQDFSQPNQDNYLINDDKKIYAVFDGHGDKGHVISSYLKESLATTFSTSLTSTSNTSNTLHTSHSYSNTIIDAFKHSFQKLDDTICKSVHSESSGSTCVMAYINNNNLYVGGVGDCTALLVQAHPSDGKFDATILSSSHKVSNDAEHDRVTKAGAQIAGDYVVCLTDPNKVINMTRAFGDQDMKSAGIISQPDISVTKLPASNNINYSSANNNNNNNNNNDTNDNNDNNATLNDNIKQYDITSQPGIDTFLMLFSDGLDQVQSTDEVARKAHQIIKANVNKIPAGNGEPLQVNTICTTVLQHLEDNVYQRDGVGFSDDATLIIVILSGFS